MKGKFIAKFFVVCLAMSWLSFIPKSYALEYEGDGTYFLHVGDRIKASNGYIIELECALGALGSRSDWLTVLRIFNPLGGEVNEIWSWGNCTRETDELYVTIERHIENEAIITVISKQVVPEFPGQEQWVPCIPNAKDVKLYYWKQNGISYINVSITFGCAGFNVSGWGTPIFEGNNISVDSEIWMWTGYSAQIVITLSNTYNLGFLRPGEYIFVFKAWGYSVKAITFKVVPNLLLTTNKRFYMLGENVTIILANIGDETVQIGGYPAWQIYTYPEENPVYPAVYAFLLWQLEPGESEVFVWNQYDAFSYTFCKPGTYIIKDTQGWDLSVLFRIYSDCDFYGPFFGQFGVEYWVVQINKRPARLIFG